MRSKAGFTLVELLVSMSIGTLVLLLAVTALRSTGDGYGRSTGGIAAEREARALLNQLGEDLSKALRGREMRFEEGGDRWRRDEIGFLCLQPRDAQAREEAIGDLCAVVYRVADVPLGDGVLRCLVRGFRGSRETFEALEAGNLASLYAERPEDEPIAYGVVEFEAEPLVREEGGGWRTWEADPEWTGPEAVRLRLVVARRQLLDKLSDAGGWESSPLLGDPEEVDRNRDLEVYEVIHPFSHEG